MYARRINDAELLPLGFHFSLPATANEGICLFQGFNRSSAKTLLCNYITQCFQDQHTAHLIRFNPLVPEQLLTEYLAHGRVVAARFVRFSIPSDIADAYGAGHVEEEHGSVELIVRARRRGFVNIRDRIQEAARGGRSPNRVLELDGYDYDTTKVELDIGGKHRTIDLGELQRLRPTVDVTGDIEFGRDGHPDRESLVAVMRGYSHELAGAMGLTPHVS